MKTDTDLGVEGAPGTCRYCGLPVAHHNRVATFNCGAKLRARDAVAERATEEEKKKTVPPDKKVRFRVARRVQRQNL